jgi:uncharacterized protein YjbI with pentapeptide repeats
MIPQDFSNQNLRGRSFKGQNLEGANFSHADIRGADFTNAYLKGANFSHATAGLQKRWVVILTCISWIIAGISGLSSGFIGAFVNLIFDASPQNQVIGWTALIVIIILGIVIIRQGLNTAVAVAVAVAVALFSSYIAWRAMKEDEKYSLIRNIAIVFAAIGGTNFRNATLTDANFIGATLKSTDLRNATLTRTDFSKTKLLNRVRVGKTYLQNTQLRQLLITGQGQDKNFDRQDLRGVNLQKAILTDASFIGADLSEANLQDADLSRAKLVQTQLDGTDFTGTTLTGAYIEDWGITNDTKFNGVRCEYVYMRLPTKENPDPLRKPDNNKEVFADGDFGDFIKPIFDTLDLYHNQGVDPRAIAISFKELAENHPDANLEIVAMEKRGEDKFLLRAKTAVTANKSELSNEYFNTYNQVKGLPEREIQLLLAEKDSQIHRLENMVMTALERPSFYAQTYQNQGDTKMTESYQSKYDQRNANNQFVDTAESGSNVRFNQTNYTPEQKQSLAEAAAEIQNLLKQLDETNPTATESEQIAHLKDNTTPNFRKRALSALQGGTEAAIDEFLLENKFLKVGKAVIKGYLQPDS